MPRSGYRKVVRAQRAATLRSLQDLGRLKREAEARRSGPPAAPAVGDDCAGTAWRLVLESMIFQAEAEVRWLDHCEASLTPDTVAPGLR